MPPPPVTLTLKVVFESRVMWATSVPILVFLGLSVLDLGQMYATDRQTDVRQHHRLMLSTCRGRKHIVAAARLQLVILCIAHRYIAVVKCMFSGSSITY